MTNYVICEDCNGSGEVEKNITHDGVIDADVPTTCAECNGTGKIDIGEYSFPISEGDLRSHWLVEEKYDSTGDTLIHINIVGQFLLAAAKELADRSQVHDNSKFDPPEKELFDEYTPKLSGCTYGSDEYKQFLSELKPALDHHYAVNTHHPEHFENGIEGMNLFDLVEMFFDWWAATKRHNDGNILKSIDINEKRFDIPPQMTQIFKNTVDYCRLNLNDPNFLILSK